MSAGVEGEPIVETAIAPSDESETHGNAVIVLMITVVLLSVGMATGIQRSLLSLMSASVLEETDDTFRYFALLVLPVVMFALFKAAGEVLAGTMGDRLGRSLLILAGMITFSLGAALVGFVGGYEGVLWGNALIGIGQGMVLAPSLATLTDVIGKRRHGLASGILELAIYLGLSIGSAGIGELVENGSYRFAFEIGSVIGGFGTLLALIMFAVERFHRREVTSRSPRKGFREIIRVYTRPTLLLPLSMAHSSKIMDAAVIIVLPLLLVKTYDFGLMVMGVLLALFTIPWAILMPLFGRLSDRVGRKLPTIAGSLLAGTGFISATFLGNVYVVGISLFLAGVGTSMYYPAIPSISVDIADQEDRGAFLGVFRAALDLGYVSGGILIVALAVILDVSDIDHGGTLYRSVLRIAASLLIAIGLLFAFFVKETRPLWAQVPTVIEHAETVRMLAIDANAGMVLYLDGKMTSPEALALVSKLKDRERQADQILEDLSAICYGRGGSAQDEFEFIKMASRIDKAAGGIYRSCKTIVHCPVDEIPEQIRHSYLTILPGLCSLLDMAANTLRSLTSKARRESLSFVKDVAALETELDGVYNDAWLWLIENRNTVQPVLWVILRDVLNSLEKAANSIQDAVEIVQILVHKHTP